MKQVLGFLVFAVVFSSAKNGMDHFLPTSQRDFYPEFWAHLFMCDSHKEELNSLRGEVSVLPGRGRGSPNPGQRLKQGTWIEYGLLIQRECRALGLQGGRTPPGVGSGMLVMTEEVSRVTALGVR